MDGTPAILIRPLDRAQEAQSCARLMADSEPWLTLRRGIEDCLRLVRDPMKEVHVGVVGQEIAGFIILHLGGPFSGYIQTVAVAPQWRNRGIGRELIKFAEQRIFCESPNVFLCVSSFNTAAQRLYSRLGYERIGELKDYVVTGPSEILMRKTSGPINGFSARSHS